MKLVQRRVTYIEISYIRRLGSPHRSFEGCGKGLLSSGFALRFIWRKKTSQRLEEEDEPKGS
ncbi:hypothetical protein COLO4_07030 [Corchorus olitorius]|uniref:Uncharacterized protein n=1 Tax=Corchorus olitorius TaxID=93759 RepID=A0A1R3KL56_9ROSI|nr:hypothetical protein COLO4_07030 [Corchorus olitorius]